MLQAAISARRGAGAQPNARSLFLGQGADHHDHLTAFHFRHVFDLAEFFDVFGQLTSTLLFHHSHELLFLDLIRFDARAEIFEGEITLGMLCGCKYVSGQDCEWDCESVYEIVGLCVSE